MPVGTVRGRFELDAPALRTLKDLQKQGITTEAQMRKLGKEIDKVGDRTDQARVRAFGKELGNLGRATQRMATKVDTEWSRATRAVDRQVAKQTAAIEALDERVTAFSRRRAVATVEVDGIASSMAQLAALEAMIHRVSGLRATPRIAPGGVMPGGGGSVPPAVPSIPGGGGGGGGGVPGGGRGGGMVGGMGTRGKVMLGAGALGLPALRALLGAGGATLGSAGMGIGGAGALGIAGAGALGVGVAGTMALAKPVAAQIKEAAKAQEALNTAVAQYGKNSDQARIAKQNLDQAMNTAPKGTRQLLRDTKALSAEWTKLTRPGRESIMTLLTGGTADLRRFNKGAGGAAANRVGRAVSREGGRASNFLAGRQGQRFATQGAGIFDANLGNFRKAGQYGFEAFTNVMVASKPFFKEATEWLKRWTRGWATGTRDIDKTRKGVGSMVDQLRKWKNLAGATWRLMKALGSAGAPAGGSMIDRLTGQLETWERWVRSNPEKVREFFRQTVDSTVKMAKGIAGITSALMKLGGQLSPLLDRFSELVTLASQLGMLNPGAAALAFGAFKGARGARGGRGGGPGAPGAGAGGTGGGPGVVPVGVGGGGGRRGAAKGTYGAARGAGMGRVGALGEALAARTGIGALSRTAAPAVGAGARGAGALGKLGGLGKMGMGAMRGAGKAFWPLALGMGVLDFASFDGGIMDKTQAALSGATFGLINKPKTDAENRDRGTRKSQEFGERLGQGGGMREQQSAIAALRKRIGSNSARFRQKGGDGPGDDERQSLTASNKELRAQLADRLGQYKSYAAQRRQILNARSREKGDTWAREFAEGFQRLSKRNGPEAAMKKSVGGVLKAMKNLGPAGKRELAQGTLTWAKTAAQKNPALLNQYKRLRQGVVAQFGAMKKNVHIVNGQIYDGSRAEWNGIAGAISSAARRGVDDTSKEFQRLRSAAIASLMSMGFDRKDAAGLFRGQQKGGKTAKIGAARIQKQATTGSSVPFANNAGEVPAGGKRARGGRILGKGLRDTVPMVDGGMAAPGELIVNRHTERDHDMDARRAGLPTLAQRVAGERRRHSDSVRNGASIGKDRAKGGGVGGMNLQGAGQHLAQFAKDASSYGLVVTSGSRPGAITNAGNVSNHSSGNAIDLGGSASGMMSYARHAASAYGNKLDELIYTPMGFSIKRGQKVAPYAQADHFDHVHVAMLGNGKVNIGAGANAGAMGGGALQAPTVKSRRSALGGIPGAMATKAGANYADAINQKLQEAVGGGAPGMGGATGGVAPGGSVRDWLTAALKHTGHFSPENLNALYGRAMQESGGNPKAINNWDSNAKAGYPSQGLLQTIPQTFAAHRDPSVPGGITDPVANAVAAIRYMYSRYGRIVAANGQGYATGGRLGGSAGGGGCSVCGGDHTAYAHGGRLGGKGGMDFAGAFARGGSFVTRRGRGAMYVAGEGATQEEVTVRPHRPRRKPAGGASSSGGGGGVNVEVNVNMGDVSVRSEADVEKIAAAVGEKVGRKLLDALEGHGSAKLAT